MHQKIRQIEVLVKYMLQFDEFFFASKSIMNTKGMALLASVFQGNINYCPQSSDVKNFNKLKRDFRMGFLIKDHCATPDVR